MHDRLEAQSQPQRIAWELGKPSAISSELAGATSPSSAIRPRSQPLSRTVAPTSAPTRSSTRAPSGCWIVSSRSSSIDTTATDGTKSASSTIGPTGNARPPLSPTLTDDIENQGEGRYAEATGKSSRAQTPTDQRSTGIAPRSDALIHAVVSGPLTRTLIDGETMRRASTGGGRALPACGEATTSDGATAGGGEGRARARRPPRRSPASRPAAQRAAPCRWARRPRGSSRGASSLARSRPSPSAPPAPRRTGSTAPPILPDSSREALRAPSTRSAPRMPCARKQATSTDPPQRAPARTTDPPSPTTPPRSRPRSKSPATAGPAWPRRVLLAMNCRARKLRGVFARQERNLQSPMQFQRIQRRIGGGRSAPGRSLDFIFRWIA